VEFAGIKAQQSRIRARVDQRIARVLDHGEFIRGPEVLELECALAGFTGVPYCVSCGNGTDALQIALMALGIGPGDEVIVPAFSFFATAEAVCLVGATPVFADVDATTALIDIDEVSRCIGARTRAVIPVSLYGQCVDHASLEALVAGRGITVIEDAAQSFGATQHGRRSCALSRIACTSFFPSKPFGCYGDGGAIFTSDPELHASMLALSQHGQTRRYVHESIGMNSRLDTLQAAVLLEKLPLLDEELHARQQVAEWYAEALAGSGAGLPRLVSGNTSAWAQYTVRLDGRDHVAHALREAGIPVAVHYPRPMHRQPAIGGEHADLPRSEALAATVLSLPMHPYLSKDEVAGVADALLTTLR
jgi:UDP-2-acetamido-2-deoxy-ribo-hexuluronate aminotransferase